MTGAALELIQPAHGVALGDEDRKHNQMVRHARIMAATPLVPRAMQGKPEVVFAAFLVCEAYGADYRLAVKQVHYMNNELVPSAQLQGGVIISRGYEISWEPEDGGYLGDDRATIAIRRPGRPWATFTATHAAAVKSGKFDEWVELWPQGQRKQVWRLRRDGKPFPHDTAEPPWVAKEVAAGNVKRFDGWWDYEEDMLACSATRKAGRRYAADALLGVDSIAFGLATADVSVDPFDVPDDDEIVDGEIVPTQGVGADAGAGPETQDSPGSAPATSLERAMLRALIDRLDDVDRDLVRGWAKVDKLPHIESEAFTAEHAERLMEMIDRAEPDKTTGQDDAADHPERPV